MKRTHTLLLLTTLPLLLIAAAAVYLWQNLPGLISEHSSRYLQPLGVEQFSVAGLTVQSRRLVLNGMALEYTSGEVEISLQVDRLQLAIDLQSLQRQRLRSIAANTARVSIRTVRSEAASAASPLQLSEWLPHYWRDVIPADSVQVDTFTADFSTDSGTQISGQGAALLTGSAVAVNFSSDWPQGQSRFSLSAGDDDSVLQIQLDVTAPVDAALEAAATLHQHAPNGYGWRWSIAGAAAHQPLLQWLEYLAETAQIEADFTAAGLADIAGTTEFEGELIHPDVIATDSLANAATLSLNGSTAIGNITVPNTLQLTNASADWSLQQTPAAMLLQTASLTATGTLDGTQLGEETRQWLDWETAIPFRWQLPSGLLLQRGAGAAWQLQFEQGQLALGAGPNGITLNAIQLDTTFLPAAETAFSASVSSGVRLRLRGRDVPGLRLSVETEGDGQSQLFDLNLSDRAESIALALSGRLAPETGAGNYTLRANSQDLAWFSASFLPVWQHLSGFDIPLRLVGGKLSLQTELTSAGYSPEQWQQRSSLAIEQLTGTWQDYPFENLNLAGDFTGISPLRTSGPVKLHIDQLNVGVPIDNLNAELTLPETGSGANTVVLIESFDSELFGGSLSLPEPTRWDFGATENALLLHAVDWQLQQLVALQQAQSINAAGSLYGNIPVKFSGGNWLIGNGFLRATEPGGSIRYQVDASNAALASSSSELQLALELLENFDYEVLESRVSLDEDGQLLLGLSLSGRNPDYENGRQVNFNINLEQNLPPLLQSLRLNDSLLEQIERRLQ